MYVDISLKRVERFWEGHGPFFFFSSQSPKGIEERQILRPSSFLVRRLFYGSLREMKISMHWLLLDFLPNLQTWQIEVVMPWEDGTFKNNQGKECLWIFSEPEVSQAEKIKLKRWSGVVKHTAQESDCQKARRFLPQMSAWSRKRTKSSQGRILRDKLKQKVNSPFTWIKTKSCIWQLTSTSKASWIFTILMTSLKPQCQTRRVSSHYLYLLHRNLSFNFAHLELANGGQNWETKRKSAWGKGRINLNLNIN